MEFEFLTNRKATRIIRKAKESGKVFSVTFIKRTTGEPRRMLCRGGVTSKLKGGEKQYEPSEYKLSVVYDMEKQAYRSIPLDSVVQIKAFGKVY